VAASATIHGASATNDNGVVRYFVRPLRGTSTVYRIRPIRATGAVRGDAAGGIRATASRCGSTAATVLRLTASGRAVASFAATLARATEDCVRVSLQCSSYFTTTDADLVVPSSNNPFASNDFIGQPTSSPVPTPELPRSTPIPSAASTPALVQGRPLSSASISSGASSLPPRTPVSARADALSAVLASAGPGGIDTFGNVGSLRYGGSEFGRTAQRTGTRTF
jgi:hypothetical protein